MLHPPFLFREISAKNVTIVSISNKLPLWQINHNLERNSVLSVFLCQDMPKLSNHSGLHFNCPLSDDRISFLFIFTTFQLILRIWGSQICLKTRTSLSQNCPYQSLSSFLWAAEMTSYHDFYSNEMGLFYDERNLMMVILNTSWYQRGIFANVLCQLITDSVSPLSSVANRFSIYSVNSCRVY